LITLSAHEIIALLLECDNNDVPTDALRSARKKLEAEFKRITEGDPVLTMLHAEEDGSEEMHHLTEYQSSLIDGYFAVDPHARILGYYKGQPVVQAHTSPIQVRGSTARRTVVVVGREGAPKTLPLSTWSDHFIPAEGVTWAEAEIAIENWLLHHQKRLSRE
jgi:hypothetical protein